MKYSLVSAFLENGWTYMAIFLNVRNSPNKVYKDKMAARKIGNSGETETVLSIRLNSICTVQL